MVVAQHTEQIELDMLVLENQILFATVNLLVASCGWHFVKQVVLKCFDNVWALTGVVSARISVWSSRLALGGDESNPCFHFHQYLIGMDDRRRREQSVLSLPSVPHQDRRPETMGFARIM
jgi:hypothetical protein